MTKQFLLMIAFAGQLASAKEVSVCADGRYLALVPAEQAQFLEGLVAGSAPELSVVSQRGTIYSLQVSGDRGFAALSALADRPGAFLECDSALSR